MKPYKIKKNEKLIVQYTIKEQDEVKNIITLYENKDGRLYVHNANGIKQEICPYMRASGLSFYCQKYADTIPDIPFNGWLVEEQFFLTGMKNPKYKNCSELKMDANNFKNCKYYRTMICEVKNERNR